MPDIVNFLWFDTRAEEAAAFYTSIFPDAKIAATTHYLADMAMPEGLVMTVDFTLDGHRFVALNGGPQFAFSEAVSFQIACRDQAEVDHYWTALTEGGEAGPCGWLKDRFGVSWQVTPTRLTELLTQGGAVAQRVTEAFMQMTKLDIDELERVAAAD